MSGTVELSPISIEAIARRVAELQRLDALIDSDPWLTRKQAAAYLNYSASSFERARRVHVEALKPCSVNPIRWSRNALDVFKLTRGRPLHHKRGRKQREAIAA